jgi:hypothetical protein
LDVCFAVITRTLRTFEFNLKALLFFAITVQQRQRLLPGCDGVSGRGGQNDDLALPALLNGFGMLKLLTLMDGGAFSMVPRLLV